MSLIHHNLDGVTYWENRSSEQQADKLLELAVCSRQYVESISQNDAHFLDELSKWALSLNEFDLNFIPPKDLSDIVAASAKSGPNVYGNYLSTLILSEEPGVAFFLACRVREGVCKPEILDVLASAITNEAFPSCAKGAMRRALASLILDGTILQEELPSAAQHLVEPLLKAPLLLKESSTRAKSKNRRIQIFLDKMDDEDALLLESREIVSNETLFKDATQAISRGLLQADSDPQKCHRYYDRLMLLQDALMEFVKQKPEEALLLILSARGTASESADSLASLEPLCGHQIALWLRAGLQSEYFRAEALSALCYGYVYGLKDSPMERQLFSAIIHGEIEQETVQSHMTDLFGESILLRFSADFENFHIVLPLNLVTLHGDAESLRIKLLRFVQPSQERILQDAIATYSHYFGQSHFVTSGRLRVVEARLRKGLDEIPEEQFSQWGQGLLRRPHTVEVQKYLWCVHTLCASGIPERKIVDDCREPMIWSIVQIEEDGRAADGTIAPPSDQIWSVRREVLQKLWYLHQWTAFNDAERCFIHNVLCLKEDALRGTSDQAEYTFYLQTPDAGLFEDFAKIDFDEENIRRALRYYQQRELVVLTSHFEDFIHIADSLYYFTCGNFNTVLVDLKNKMVIPCDNIYFLDKVPVAGPNNKLYIHVHDHNRPRTAPSRTSPRQIFEIRSRSILKIEGKYPYDVGHVWLGLNEHVYAKMQFEANGSYFDVDLTTGKYR